MEASQYSLLEELLGPRKENWTEFPASTQVNNDEDHNHNHHHDHDHNDDLLFPSGWSYEPCYESLDFTTSNSSLSEALITPNSQVENSPTFACSFNDIYPPFVNANGYSTAEIDTSSSIKTNVDAFDHPFPLQDGNFGVFGRNGGVYNFEEMNSSSSKEQATCLDMPFFEMGKFQDRRSKMRKVEGQPSKNLMAERRRRKRLNDRLSMLRSVVPKVSKMDRTSILGDTIDYMKELLEKIQKLQNEDHRETSQLISMKKLNELTTKDSVGKNSSKFNVERRENSTEIQISCAEKPGLLLSTVNTIETLGLDIQHCVISSFNDFSLQASCIEAAEHRAVLSCEDLKQALHRNAGYGGRRCL